MLTKYRGVDRYISYNEILYDGEFHVGGCANWKTFGLDLQSSQEKDRVATSVSFYGITGLNNPILSTDCRNETIAREIQVKLTTLLTTTSVASTDIYCESHIWKLHRCDTNSAGDIAMCVDCEDPCLEKHPEMPIAQQVNPCGVTRHRERHDTQLRVFMIRVKDTNLPAPITDITLVPSKTSVTLSVKVDFDTIVHCKYYSQEDIKMGNPTVIDVVLADYRAVTTNNKVNMTLIEMSPSTTYTIFCATEALKGGLMQSDELMLTSGRTTTTKCCLLIQADMTKNVLVQAKLPYNKFIIASTSMKFPQQKANVEVIVKEKGAMFDSTRCVLSPRFITLRMESDTVGLSLSYCPLGEYTISIEADEGYTVVLSRGYEFKVVSEFASVPKMTSAIFADDFTSLIVNFDVPTSASGVFPCAEVFVFDAMSHSTCSWSSTTSVLIQFTYYSTLAPDDWIAIPFPGNLTVLQTSSLPPLQNITTTIFESYFVPIPDVVIVAPSSTSVRNSTQFDLSYSTGSAGRNWQSITFTVATLPSDSMKAAVLHEYLNTNYTLLQAKIPQGYLFHEYTYVITVQLCNFVGYCGSESYSLSVKADPIPLAVISGPPTRSMTTDMALSLSVAYSSSFQDEDYSYIWRIYIDEVEEVSLTSRGISASEPLQFSLPKNALNGNTRYEVRLYTIDTLLDISVMCNVYLNVKIGPLVARINSGTEIAVPPGVAVSLDASSSYDSNIPESSTDRLSHLSSTWSCQRLYTTESNSRCAVTMTGTRTGQTVVVNADTPAGSVLEIRYKINDDTRSDYALIQIHVLESNPPLMTIASNGAEVPSRGILKLLGTLDWSQSSMKGQNSVIRWNSGENMEDLPLAAMSLNPIERTSRAPIEKMNVAIPVSSLEPYMNRPSLTFRLSCVFPESGVESWATITVSINAKPTPGTFEVTPSSGSELSTIFELSANFWDDRDIPLTYEFHYSTKVGLSTTLLRARSDNKGHSSYLPAADVTVIKTTYLYLSVYDSKDAFITVNTSVLVYPFTPSLNNLNSLVNDVQSTSAVSRSLQKAAMVSDSLSKVVCSNAPNCTSLFRQPCSSTINTCGPCLSSADYYGESGDANTACVLSSTIAASSSTLHSRFLQETSIDIHQNVSCTDNMGCMPWQVCDININMCRSRPKECIADCSGNGDCIYYNVFDGSIVSTCLNDDNTCIARCVCDFSHGGNACDLYYNDYLSRQSASDSLMEVMIASSSGGDNTKSTSSVKQSFISSYLTTFDVTSQQSNLLTLQGQVLANLPDEEIVYDFMMKPFVMLETNTLASIFKLIAANRNNDDRRRRLSSVNSNSDIVAQMLVASFEEIASELVAGQYPVEYVNTYYSYSFHGVAPDEAGYNFTSPLSLLQMNPETSSDSTMITMSFPKIGSDTKIGIVAINQNALQEPLNADVVQLHVQDSELCISSPCEFGINFPHYNIIPYNTTYITEVVRVPCTTKVESHVIDCLSGGSTTVSCDGLAGNYDVYCLLTLNSMVKTRLSSQFPSSLDCTATVITDLSSSFHCALQAGVSATSSSEDSSVSIVLGRGHNNHLTEISSTPTTTVVQMETKSYNVSSTRLDIEIFYYDSYAMLMRVNVVFSFMWMLWIFMYTVGYFKDKAGEEAMAFTKIGKVSNIHKAWKSKIHVERIIKVIPNSVDILALREVLLNKLNVYCSGLLKGVYTNGPYYKRSEAAMITFNEYADIFLNPDSSPLYFFKLLRAFTRCTLIAFVMLQMNMHLYANDSADDCWRRRTAEECVALNDVYEATGLLRRYCVWERTIDMADPNCKLSDPDITINSSIYLALIGLGAMMFLNVPLDLLFEYVLFAYDAPAGWVKKISVEHKNPVSSPKSADTKIPFPGFDSPGLEMLKNDDISEGYKCKIMKQATRLDQLVHDVNMTYSSQLVYLQRDIMHLRADLAQELKPRGDEDLKRTIRRRKRLSMEWGFHKDHISNESITVSSSGEEFDGLVTFQMYYQRIEKAFLESTMNFFSQFTGKVKNYTDTDNKDTVSSSEVVKKSIEEMIVTDMNNGGTQSTKINKKMAVLNFERKEAILFAVFFNDLLGRWTPTGTFFHHYVVSPLLRTSTKTAKAGAVFMCFSLCSGCVIYSLYNTMNHPSNGANVWLDSWLYGSILAVALEIGLISRLRTFVCDDIIPRAILTELEQAKTELSKHEVKMNNILDRNKLLSKFSGSTYIYVANAMISDVKYKDCYDNSSFAKFIIATYKNPLPMLSNVHWENEVNNPEIFKEKAKVGYTFYEHYAFAFAYLPRFAQILICDFVFISGLLFGLYSSVDTNVWIPILALSSWVGCVVGFHMFVRAKEKQAMNTAIAPGPYQVDDCGMTSKDKEEELRSPEIVSKMVLSIDTNDYGEDDASTQRPDTAETVSVQNGTDYVKDINDGINIGHVDTVFNSFIHPAEQTRRVTFEDDAQNMDYTEHEEVGEEEALKDLEIDEQEEDDDDDDGQEEDEDETRYSGDSMYSDSQDDEDRSKSEVEMLSEDEFYSDSLDGVFSDDDDDESSEDASVSQSASVSGSGSSSSSSYFSTTSGSGGSRSGSNYSQSVDNASEDDEEHHEDDESSEFIAEGDYDDNIEADENSYNDDEEESSEEGDAEEESV